MIKNVFLAAILSMVCLSLTAAVQTAPQASDVDQQKQVSANVAMSWLSFVDRGQYGDSWDNSSEIFRATISKDEWVNAMNRMRDPLGRVTARDVIEQKAASDPRGLPAGDYMVLLYNTTFSNKPSGVELVTLRFENGKWKVLTYQVK